MRRVLGIGRHLVAPSTRISGHLLCPPDERILERSVSITTLRELLSDLDTLFVIERNKWHPHLFAVAKEMGIFLCVIPNWEWLDPSDPAYALVDMFIVHSDFALDALRRAGFQNSMKLAPPVDLSCLPIRAVSSTPKVFLHNAGIIDQSDRKGTLATFKAWERKRPSIASLVVRYQKSEIPLPDISDIPNLVVEHTNRPYVEELYAFGECAIQPSRLEGLGFMILEPILCGIPTVIPDAPPMNEWTSGTILCPGGYSAEPSIPAMRGIGDAALFDVDISLLTSCIEELESLNLRQLSLRALRFRQELSAPRVREKWRTSIEGAKVL